MLKNPNSAAINTTMTGGKNQTKPISFHTIVNKNGKGSIGKQTIQMSLQRRQEDRSKSSTTITSTPTPPPLVSSTSNTDSPLKTTFQPATAGKSSSGSSNNRSQINQNQNQSNPISGLSGEQYKQFINMFTYNEITNQWRIWELD